MLSAALARPATLAAETDIAGRLAAADHAVGDVAFTTCTVCHTTRAGAGHKIGPNLWNVVGRDVASAEGFSYSKALRELPGAWSFEALDAFLADPAGYAPGTAMVYPGIGDDETRAAVILHLRDLSDAPVPLPAASAVEGAASAASHGETDPFGEDWPEGRGRSQTGFLCSTCHSLALVKQQRLSRARWDELLDWMVEEQGMPRLDAQRRDLVLDYLENHFGPDVPR